MKIIVVYYSLEGNCEYVALKIKEKLDCDLLRIEPIKEYPNSGFKKFLWGGKSAVMAETPELLPYKFDKEAYDLIIIGFPVWAGNLTPPLRTFVRDNDLSDKKVAAYACQSGAGGENALKKLTEAIGNDELLARMVLVDPKSKPHKDNDIKIEEFCKKLIENE